MKQATADLTPRAPGPKLTTYRAEGLARATIAPQDRLGLARTEAAEYVGISATLFDDLVRQGKMPPAKALGGRRVWSRPALERAFADLPDAIADGAAEPQTSAPSVWSNPKL